MPSDPRLRNVPASPRETLFRTVDSILRADPLVGNVFSQILSWQGDPKKDRQPLAIDQGNAMRLTPHVGPETWWAASEQKGSLVIDVELLVRGICWDDLDRAWYAVERAFYPFDRDARDALVRRLQLAYGWKGLMEFNAPALDPSGPNDGAWRAHGQMRIEFRIPGFWS